MGHGVAIPHAKVLKVNKGLFAKLLNLLIWVNGQPKC